MAGSVQSDPAPSAWWKYFFLYDGSKVKEEGDPTQAGICYFNPRQTPLDQQELLCGQIAGMARCVAEISGSPPGLIRMRKAKFAVKVDGNYLWVLGCTTDLPDISCRQFLEQLIGLFRFYHGPLHQAYLECAQEELDQEWERYAEHLQRNTSDLHRIFNSLWALDKTKVDPLLLLKAALTLQACQRTCHVLAGCISYKGLVVSTQLPPDLSAKVLLQEMEADPKGEPENAAELQTQEPSLPQGVRITTVYLLEDEAAPLWDLPVEWMTRFQGSPASSKEGKTSAGATSRSGGAPLVRMALYVHHVRGLVLSLLAEEQFAHARSSIEDVYHSSLASLNGLEVHLKETLPKASLSLAKATYGFAHYDALQNVLATNFLPTTNPQDRPFLRAASLIHADFNQLPSASEITVRNASVAVYACRNAVHETYFQQEGPPFRNSGVPNPHDAAFGLPSKAKQKLLKHGVNLL
ncbi:BLOC-3 complex member HPS4 [Rhineura floridana]|uniref:BLOC-3 complex member HPS4 n=1 Tax=Rhineura floridana TaxID=261503 RepID=UPI002AC7FC7B|nr:BLOC-3 complex member HPS4 [Rhineura floridana]XP_061459104.1 BLOC-3 complex member HPS4 [Rhineura floridana]